MHHVKFSEPKVENQEIHKITSPLPSSWDSSFSVLPEYLEDIFIHPLAFESMCLLLPGDHGLGIRDKSMSPNRLIRTLPALLPSQHKAQGELQAHQDFVTVRKRPHAAGGRVQHAATVFRR